jgi:hypothetical protein
MAKNTTLNDLTAPTVHLNGSDGKKLEGDLDAAARAVQTAINAHSECYPHGRDYYPQGDGAYDSAVAQWKERQLKLTQVMSDLMEIGRNVHRQGRR